MTIYDYLFDIIVVSIVKWMTDIVVSLIRNGSLIMVYESKRGVFRSHGG